ncbi:hypothetical protein [Lysinibacillus sp. BW-2-10]|uniref:hypothetical protein n=1 Tax=Lysinibacillus sp. BW-2-10 TaxID=2590030 RepID=UPI00117C883A|nr:hypothetical protein [Lysinibacillus sp. BW-2-10]TSI11047.1 hypothetical protein FJQ64_02415 [Lysinibacillus sp. BW-2-10]
MLYIRHTVGSRLFFETTEYNINQLGNGWGISFLIDKESADTLIKFRNELNIFHVEGDHQKTWYYSSEGKLEFLENEGKFVIFVDHKTVYPV